MRVLIALLAATAFAATPAMAAGGGAHEPKSKRPPDPKRKLAAPVLPSGAPDASAYAVTASGQLIWFATGTPGKAKPVDPLIGLAWKERITGLDFRPSNRMLYAVTDRSRLFSVDIAAGTATLVGDLTQKLAGSGTGTDFNPVPDRLRIVNDADQNLRANPADAVSTADKTLAYARGDRNAGSNPQVVAAAYINNVAGAKETTLYVIDTARDVLAIQAPPNDGVLKTVGSLGVGASGAGGFDILTDANGANHAFAALQTGRAGTPRLYWIDLTTGRATDLGRIGTSAPLVGFALALP